MKRAHHLVFLLLILGGLGMAAMVVPRPGELALIHYKDKDYEAARSSYEKRFASGDRSFTVVIPLSDLYLQYGEVEKAVSLMEDSVRRNPNNLEALKRLGRFHQYAEQPQAYLRTLEHISALDPSETNLQLLSKSYNFTSQFDKQIATLKELTDKYPAEPQNFLDLARIQASRGSIADAHATMLRFENLHPGAETAETVELHLNLLLDLGHVPEAIATASRWARSERNYDTLAYFAELFNFRKQPAAALRLVEPYEKDADRCPNLLREIMQLDIATGQSGTAYARMKQLCQSGKLPESCLELFLSLALSRGEAELAFEAARMSPMTVLPVWLQVQLAESALDAGKEKFLNLMLREVGQGFLEQQPALGARLALARKDAGAAQSWVERAEKLTTLDTRQEIELANVYAALGRPSQAIRAYEQVLHKPDAPDSVCGALAGLYVETGRSQDGLALLETARKQRRSREAEAAWALVAASARQGDRVLAWFRSGASKWLPAQTLSDLYFASSGAGNRELARELAQRLFELRGKPEDQLHLALALLAAGKPAEALSYVRPLWNHVRLSAGSRPDVQECYLSALTEASAAGAPLTEELRQYWSSRLSLPGLSETKRDEIVYALLDLKDYRAVLGTVEEFARYRDDQWLHAYADLCVRSGQTPRLLSFLEGELDRRDSAPPHRESCLRLLLQHGGFERALSRLRQFAEGESEEWASAYEEALQNLGRKPELVSFLKERADRRARDRQAGRAIAFQLLDLGDKHSAEEVLLKIAAEASPDSPEVSELLYLWGPRAPTAALDWLQARAGAARGAEKAAWMRHLIDVGAANRAASLAPPDESDGKVIDACLEAFSALGDRAAIGRVVLQALQKETDLDRLRRLAHRASESGQTDAARSAFEKVLSAYPEDRDALKQLGSIALWEGNFSRARGLLGRFLSAVDTDYEAHFYLGEALAHAHDERGARRHFERSLDLVEASQLQTAGARLLRAQLLQRVGRLEESLDSFKVLVTERPRDENLRAEYVSVLLQTGRFGDAKRALSDGRER